MSLPEPPIYGGIPQRPMSPPEAIAWGWRKFTQFLGPVMIGVAIYVAFSVLVAVAGGIVSAATDVGGEFVEGQARVGLETGSVVFQLVINVVSWVGGVILGGAAARAALDVADGRQYDFINAARRIPIGKLFGALILFTLAAVAILFVLVIPFVLVGVFLHASLWILVPLGVAVLFAFVIATTALQYLLILVLVDDPTTPFNEAFGTTFRLARANLTDVFVLTLLLMLVIVAGFLALCVGMFVAYPVAIFAAAGAYRGFRGQPVAP